MCPNAFADSVTQFSHKENESFIPYFHRLLIYTTQWMHKSWRLKHKLYQDFYLFTGFASPEYLKIYIWVVRTYSGRLSICKTLFKALLYSVWSGKNGACQGHYVSRLFDLNGRSCWFLLFCGLDGYYAAPWLVQTSQVLSAFMCFKRLRLQLLLALSSKKLPCQEAGEEAVDFFFSWCLDLCYFSRMRPWHFWYQKYLRTNAFRNCFWMEWLSSLWEFQ